MASRTARADFEAIFPLLVQDLSDNVNQYGIPSNALKWFQTSLNANTPGGKLNRGLSVPDTGLALLGKLSDEQFKHLCTLGWLTELLQAFFLVSDDMMDGSHTRRGKPCWHRRPGVNLIAINDSFMLESSIYVILKKHFRFHPAYVDFLELFHEVSFQTELGQLCDLLTAPEDNVNLDNFNMDKFNFIVIYKTAYYSFYLPVALALHYLQLATPGNLRQAHDILIPLGQYFQAQDDYLDVFGKPEQIGKVGTDIQDNKCSWVINQALKRCSPEQRKVLDESYGRKDATLEAKAKAVFNELDLEKVYRDFEEDQVRKIRGMIEGLDESEGLKKGVFESFLAKIYKRDK
ncbi:farnesyl pyrophosphate synthetase [Paracoccidioides lutzii Pb01]|uniref:Farnesyl pyrophosphate synthetase n=1 Tax=Paracoccidioides lutzii (strain ATCC MYA-826 / Pb01) TaxID=502779 RepID=C1H938_PARBA|nr:farnesyl pyrophosphate synthetase [Paracoccidioides lutzii Pb01]EEH36861.1 farnesyl pyrophosphate synthetase [Paracoccidioides lutzii Pb01]